AGYVAVSLRLERVRGGRIRRPQSLRRQRVRHTHDVRPGPHPTSRHGRQLGRDAVRLSALEEEMKNVALAVASAFAIAPAFAQWDGPYHAAQPRSDERDYARVIESTPVYTAAREECWNPRIQDFEEMRGRNNGLDTSYCRKTSGE